ncbi:bacteriocin [Epilithonimonas hominis]|uniref:bacteriocin n=1 Tax=Epilithonimonas hominis TaxID=420404 RepID=UPI00289EF33E|nr:bacteriocin [Epilithonimonas hominis]
MEKKPQNQKKIDITSLKVIDKKNLNSIYGGTAAPQVFTSLVNDEDPGGGFCSIAADIDG